MLPENRRLQIVEQLNRSPAGMISVSELSHTLGVSEMTIRRDLDVLEKYSIITRVHGGAVAYQGSVEKSFNDRLEDASPQKKAIGWAAAQLVQDGDRIILDAGTTTQQVAANLIHRQNLTVITNNLHIAAEFSCQQHIQTVVLGGVLKCKEVCTIGPAVRQQLAGYKVDLLFLSTAGFSLEAGITDIDFHEVEIKQAMMQSARRVILVADSSKFNRVELLRTGDMAQIHTLVSDDDLPAEAISAFEERGITVLTPARQAARLVTAGQTQ